MKISIFCVYFKNVLGSGVLPPHHHWIPIFIGMVSNWILAYFLSNYINNARGNTKPPGCSNSFIPPINSVLKRSRVTLSIFNTVILFPLDICLYQYSSALWQEYSCKSLVELQFRKPLRLGSASISSEINVTGLMNLTSDLYLALSSLKIDCSYDVIAL
jgi:hypothetical protein